MRARTAVLTTLVSFALLFGTAFGAVAQSLTQQIYNGSLQNNWANWSWAPVNFSNTKPVYNGEPDSISVTPGSYQALYLHHDAFNTGGYVSLDFWINGGSAGGQLLQVQATLSGAGQAPVALAPLVAHKWTHVVLTLSQLSVEGAGDMDGFWLQDATGNGTPTFYVDDITLVAGKLPPPPPATVKVDVTADQHPISPLIYGVAWPNPGQVADLNAPIDRAGGNETTRYNWELDAQQKGNDWYFESWPSDSNPTPAPGETIDTFISGDKAAGAQSMVTMPMIGWAATLGPNRSVIWSYSVAKYGAQQAVDSGHPDAGNGVLASTGANVVNDPTDADVAVDVAFQTGWFDHLVNTWGTAANGGVGYYLTDNESSIWFSTHRDVHPVGPTMDEIVGDIEAYAAALKGVDPSALVAGPEEWGWDGYFYSGYDQQYGSEYGWSNLPDRAAHGGMDYVPYILQQMQDYQNTTGQRLLDMLSLHFYPQAGEASDDESPTTELLRNRSTRQLWDPNYISESWIDAVVELIPRMKNWVSTYYPGTKIGITEYNWGDEGGMNGATTQADIYGIFGQQGLDLGTRWTTPATGSPVYLAMKMYRNYDGNDSTFGDTSVSDTAPNPDNLSSFAALRSSDGALTVMAVNKYLTGTTKFTLKLSHFTPGPTAQVWQLASGSLSQLADEALVGTTLIAHLPAQSVTLYIIEPAPVLTSTTVAHSVVGGNTAAGSVTINRPAPSTGTLVTLSSTNPAVASVPSSVTILSGQTTAPITITTTAVTAATKVTITAKLRTVRKSATITVKP